MAWYASGGMSDPPMAVMVPQALITFLTPSLS